MNKVGEYRNGNYFVEIFDDGTKVRTLDNDANEFVAKFPESIDVKCTNFCDMNCSFCHEKSSVFGKHGNIEENFFDTLNPYTELALGGGNFLSHPNYLELLKKLKKKNIFPNITLHQTHVKNNLKEIKSLIKKDLIKGLGISFSGNLKELENILKSLDYENIVVHVINGIITIKELQAMSRFKIVPKILILGYKTFGRGVAYKKVYDISIMKNQKDVQRDIRKILMNFPVVSFDNLALEQVDLTGVVSKKEFEEFYMGDDGQHTMYIDLVDRKYAKNSRSEERFDLSKDIKKMFDHVKSLT